MAGEEQAEPVETQSELMSNVNHLDVQTQPNEVPQTSDSEEVADTNEPEEAPQNSPSLMDKPEEVADQWRHVT